MGGEADAAADVLTGSIVAGTIEGQAGTPDAHGTSNVHVACANCGFPLTGAYCAACGQPAHIHRSLLSLGHDILHGVFHFEGKIWRTVPELLFHPGRLTRRYIDGERAKFVSPMALFLFIVFLMYAVFSLTGNTQVDPVAIGRIPVAEWQAGNARAMESTEEEIEAAREQLDAPDLSEEDRAKLSSEIADLESAYAVMEALAAGDFDRIAEIKKEEQERQQTNQANTNGGINFNFGAPALEQRLNAGVRELKDNPQLALYKLKTNAYKFSWALIPLSVPFLWLLFFWRRDIHVYDHAVFATYSLSFVMLLLIVLSLAAMALGGSVWALAVILPPVHLYKQLRGTYGLSRAGALVRLFFLLIATFIVLTIFVLLLVLLGVVG